MNHTYTIAPQGNHWAVLRDGEYIAGLCLESDARACSIMFSNLQAFMATQQTAQILQFNKGKKHV